MSFPSYLHPVPQLELRFTRTLVQLSSDRSIQAGPAGGVTILAGVLVCLGHMALGICDAIRRLWLIFYMIFYDICVATMATHD